MGQGEGIGNQTDPFPGCKAADCGCAENSMGEI